MSELCVALKVSYENPARYVKWMPIGASDRIDVCEDAICISILHKLESAGWASQPTEDEIKRTTNNGAHRLFVEVRCDIRRELADYIISVTAKDAALQDEYLSLGKRIQTLVVKRLNRLSAYLAASKGQYWIDQLQADEVNPGQFFIEHEAQATIEGSKVPFDPQRRSIKLDLQFPSAQTMVSEADWPAVREFVVGDRSVPLPRSLIAGAYRLASQGARRNALVDAVTAIEVAVNKFARGLHADRLARFRPGLEPTSAPALFAKVGLRGAFGVALPLLLTEEEFPEELLQHCRAAIEKRNAIVHQGSRDVDQTELAKFLSAAKRACELLEHFSDTETN